MNLTAEIVKEYLHYNPRTGLWCWIKRTGPKAQRCKIGAVRVAGKAHYLGLFPTAELAHAAYIKAAKQHFGEFARAQ